MKGKLSGLLGQNTRNGISIISNKNWPGGAEIPALVTDRLALALQSQEVGMTVASTGGKRQTALRFSASLTRPIRMWSLQKCFAYMDTDPMPYLVRLRRPVGTFDLLDGNIDVEVVVDQKARYVATFFTLSNIRMRMAEYQKTKECAGGLYFWARNMIVVTDLSDESIATAVEHLIQSGEFESAFSRLEDRDGCSDEGE